MRLGIAVKDGFVAIGLVVAVWLLIVIASSLPAWGNALLALGVIGGLWGILSWSSQ